ncbi:hypothetical protein J2Y45_004840 [Dyadobacter sp. BE34]|uniref:Uncharacterized protein n=1 Tax=Dyadobacter fermentans TaxID=94254 RepID=A0ABU1R4Y7_9BACT|nr:MULTISPECIES: hypothetical protein [Dyadobacter]MDR6807640.1 hypothetical protein [Dyadobacter fermentans]MDR7045381.1 hypothetical protein [Dyadobacter sp. BE242]MDR7199694.1 hypothetical protein [Dyadobacter sp. BE34]MDR7217847.1 hypothetical protein [Dyadobacter sp. BE31]MDR7265585.1 hypothetical protein [Dyadobacter sp. BE32]
MKKHPVDDLFKRKLEGLERKPSENAWLKIQEKQSASPVRRRPVVWGWYAAAGVAAAVIGGYLVWQNQQGVSPGGIQTQQTVAVVKPAPVDSVLPPIEKPEEAVGQLAATEENDIKPATHFAKIAKTPKATHQVIETSVADAEPIQNAQVVAIAEKSDVPVNTIQPGQIKSPVAQDIKTLPDEPAVSRVSKPEPEPTRTIVVAVETGTNEAEEKPRNTRFARVFRQLKNARAGEKVDWDEVGFNPKNLVARVDDRLRNKEDRSSEKDHPKDKTKL